MKCPLCSGEDFGNSWLGTIYYREKDFVFYECGGCRSLICGPMPNEANLIEMYGSSYFEKEGGFEDNSLAKFDEVIDFLETQERGVFLDYGCGDGRLLEELANRDWEVIGIEFSSETVEKLSSEKSFEVVSYKTAPSRQADIIHLGDVIEHLTDLDQQMPQIMELLKRDGIFIAHGPLEGNPNIFNLMLRLSRRIKNSKITNIAPFHVILATSQGQRKLFERLGLSEITFRVTEINFPAPYRLQFRDVKSPRKLALFMVRKMSQFVSSLTGVENAGNRYFYVGRKS